MNHAWKRAARLGTLGLLALLILAALGLRFFRLTSLPLLEADEAYYGLQTLRLLRGDSFAWRTPSGNMLSPLFVATQAPILALTGPTVWALRLPAALGGLAAALLAFRVGGRITGSLGAWMAALILLTLPAAVLFSRYGCEFSQTPFVGLVAAGLAWHGRVRLFWLWIGFSLVAHPTNIFLLPFFFPALFVRFLMANPAGAKRFAVATLAGGLLVVAPFAAWMLVNPNVQGHAEDARNWLRFLDGFGRFLSFAPTVADPSREIRTDAEVWGFRLGFGLFVVLGVWRLARLRSWDRLALFGGWLAGLSAFHVAAGAWVLDTIERRYGAVLIAPTALAASTILSAWIAPVLERLRLGFRELATAGLLAPLALGLLVCSKERSIEPFLAGEAFRPSAFLTPDPFSETAAAIRADLAASEAPSERLVVTQDLFINGIQYEYLLYDDPVRVVPYFTLWEVWMARQDPGGPALAARRRRLIQALERGAYAVSAPGTPPDRGGGQIEAIVARLDRFGTAWRWSNARQRAYRLEPSAVPLDSPRTMAYGAEGFSSVPSSSVPR